jgi:hypothetical protein
MFIVSGKSRSGLCSYGPFETEEQAEDYLERAYLNKNLKWSVERLYKPHELALYADSYNPRL